MKLPKQPKMLAAGSFPGPFVAALDNHARTSTAGMPTDSRREVTKLQRVQLLRKSRWLFNNFGLLRSLARTTARYSVGSGITPIPLTEDPEFNKAAKAYFCDWASSTAASLDRKRTFFQMQARAAVNLVRDGDLFLGKIVGEPEEIIPGYTMPAMPRLQFMEAQDVGNSGSSGEIDEKGFRDGVKLDSSTREVLQYNILLDKDARRMDMSASQAVDASSIIHIADFERAAQVRGLPWAYHGLNSAIDVLDLTALEKHAAKIHAAFAASIKKNSPGSKSRTGVTGDLTREKQSKSAGGSRVVSYENFMGGAGILQLALDEELSLLTSNRPNQTFGGFMDYLVKDICVGFGISSGFLWNIEDYGGPDARMVLDGAGRFFEEVQDLLVTSGIRPVYCWVLAAAIERKELKYDASKVRNPYACAFQGPRHVTIDEKQMGNIDLERLKNGCLTWGQYYAARGQDGGDQIRKRIDELADAMEYADLRKVPFDYVMQLNMGGAGGPSEDPSSKTDVKSKKRQSTTKR